MITDALIKGLALGLMLFISVGPVIFSIIKQSINNGHKGGYFFIAGVSASDISLVLLCNFFTALFVTARSHEKVIGIVGSLFLIFLGIYTIFFKKLSFLRPSTRSNRVFRKRDLAAIFFSGFFMNLLNPGLLVFWFAVSAKIMADSINTIHPGQYRFIVFTTCLVFVLFTDILKVLLAGKIRTKLTPRNILLINRLSGLIYIGFGIALIWGVLFHSDKFMH